MSAPPRISPVFNGIVITRYKNGVKFGENILNEGEKCETLANLLTEFIESGNLFDQSWVNFSTEKTQNRMHNS
jgi:hypothetical protein